MDEDALATPPQGLAKWHARRTLLIDRIADALLEQGVATIPLRDLARRVGVSDRMLLYYFETQAELVGAALQRLSERLAVQLAGASPDGRLPPARLFKAVNEALAEPSVMQTLRVWADVSARGARNEAPFKELAQGSVAGWLTWIDERLDLEDDAQRARVAAAMLVVVEGVRMIEMSAPGATGDVANILAKAFET